MLSQVKMTNYLNSIIQNLPRFKRFLNIGALLSIVLICIFLYRLSTLYSESQIRNNSKPKPSLSLSSKKPATEKQKLFEDLVKSEALFEMKEDGRIVLAAKDYALYQKVTKGYISKKDELLLDRLYNSISGKALQHQIKMWNHSRLFAAVRDNIPRSGKITTSNWTPLNHWQEKPISTDWVPLSFGYINGGRLQKGFSDWISVTDEMPIRFTSTVNISSKKTITIQVIGQPDLNELKGKKNLYACYPLTLQERKHGKIKPCEKINAPDPSISAYLIKIKLNAGLHKLVLKVKPAINSEKVINGLAISLSNKNKFIWRQTGEYKRNPVASENDNYSFSIITQDGKSLINPVDATPSRFSSDNGLVPLIGFDKSDRYALTGLIARSNIPHDKTTVRLTLNSRLQSIAQKQLLKEISTLGSNKIYADRRRAAVVLLNPQTGAILAAANYPKPPLGIHRWDRLSYSRLYPNRDPFGVNAWQGLDNNNAPGSTFKTVTALAALQAADEGRDDLEKMVKGLSPRDFEALTGLPINASSYQPDPEATTEVFNAGHAQLAIALPYPTKTKKNKNIVWVKPKLRIAGGDGCPAKPVYSSTLGMREAVRDSLNVWFARLGVMMDKDNLDTGGKDTSLAAMATLLGFGSVNSLASDKFPLKRILGVVGRGDVLNAFAGGLSLNNSRIINREQNLLQQGKIERNSALQRLTQNSFGQGVSTTPLQMAKVAASIATGKIPQPFLISQWDDNIYEGEKNRKLKPSLIQYLKQGMKAVTEDGTAMSAFNRYYKQGKCRTYGKTGSAQVKKAAKTGQDSAFNTAWFIGWHENKEGKPDVSFACMVTHAYAKHKRSGGSVCAPIIARILKQMTTKTSKKKRKNKKHKGA